MRTGIGDTDSVCARTQRLAHGGETRVGVREGGRSGKGAQARAARCIAPVSVAGPHSARKARVLPEMAARADESCQAARREACGNPAGCGWLSSAHNRAVVGNALGVKASGGVRSAEQGRMLIAAGASRLGSSSSVALVGGSR